jgi:hypothetical protein
MSARDDAKQLMDMGTSLIDHSTVEPNIVTGTLTMDIAGDIKLTSEEVRCLKEIILTPFEETNDFINRVRPGLYAKLGISQDDVDKMPPCPWCS